MPNHPHRVWRREILLSVTTSRYAADMLSVDGGLSKRDMRVLDFEGSWWLYPQPKDRAVKEFLGMSSTRYYQVLRRLLDDASALEYAPMTIRRLQRFRRSRRDAIAPRVGDGER